MSERQNSPRIESVATRRMWRWPLAVLVVLIGALAWSRVGALGLPAAPSGLTMKQSGLSGLSTLKRLDDHVRGDGSSDLRMIDGLDDTTCEAADLARGGLALIRENQAERGLEQLRDAVLRAPANLVFSNAYRMIVFQLRRAHLRAAHADEQLTPAFPPYLDRQPIAFFERLAASNDAREVRLQLALAWVDEMLLFPALEIKAPSSVASVDILSAIIEDGNAGYVPALFARGLNHLHRPARLVWPESNKTPPDVAARDIGLCVRIGRRFDAGSARLHARLAITLGDAYVKAGRFGVARSWWQIAQNLSRDSETQESVRTRYGWPDEEMVDRLELELDRARLQLSDPMTDLALMWN